MKQQLKNLEKQQLKDKRKVKVVEEVVGSEEGVSGTGTKGASGKEDSAWKTEAGGEEAGCPRTGYVPF